MVPNEPGTTGLDNMSPSDEPIACNPRQSRPYYVPLYKTFTSSSLFAQVSPADLQRLERRIQSINGMAQIQHAERADVPVEYVLGIGGFDLERVDTEVRHLQCLLMQQDAYLTPDQYTGYQHACASLCVQAMRSQV